MSKAIERRMTLKDQVTPTMSKINKSTVTYKKRLKNLRNEGKRTWSGLKTGIVATAAAMAGLIYSADKAEEAYTDQSTAEVKLQAVMKSTGKATAEQVKGLQSYASTMQGVGIIGDELTLAAMQQLATFNVTSSTVETLTEGMLDLAAQQKGVNATQSDMVSIGNLVGKVMDGQTSSLSRYGVSFSDAQEQVLKYGTEAEKAATLAEVLRQNVGGVNAALAETDAGEIQQAKNAVGDLQETAGGAVVKIKAGLASIFMDYLPQIESGVNRVTSAVGAWVDAGGIDAMVNNVKLVVDTVKMLAPVIAVATGAVIGYKLAAMAAAVEQWSLNAALTANPVGVVIMAVAALIGVVVLVRKNIERLKLGFMMTWNVVATYGEKAINGYIKYTNAYINAIVYMKDSIVYYIGKMWNTVVQKSESAVKKMVKPLNAVLSAIGKDTISIDFSSAVKELEAPTMKKTQYIKEIQVAKFSDDDVMNQIEKAKAEKAKYETEKQTEAIEAVASALGENTEALTENTSALNSTTSSDLSGEEIADKLLPRLERAVYG